MQKLTEPRFYIGHAVSENIRYKSSSGGIGTALIKYLMQTGKYGTCLTFKFNEITSKYEPLMIHSFEDYNICGSIYQDTDTVKFVRDNLAEIKSGIIITCLPCQVGVIRHILNQHNIKSFIISFCCSGQMKVQGTWCYYKFLGIKKKSVVNLQYRGNGWPSGIQITLKNGTIIKRKNWSYPWNLIHQSLLFRPKRCLSCSFKTVSICDVSLADPWLKEYETDTIGNTLVIVNSIQGAMVIENMMYNNNISCVTSDEETYIRSQKGTIESKKENKNRLRYNKMISVLASSPTYMFIVTIHPLLMKLHNRLMSKISLYLQ
ncbi:Coenzyme F420 hydrogenase/dehydrogenase, beta subunit C-terminal domain [Segatella copri]|uniref:Coenzyme F420 hydrogenase/dehydrogenase, beta subunit C-terminal domain n=1 Tax=Segatella copri TaxID=165179 RepID=A0AAW4N4L5_9BACT|nr:Coenzyme F420 hydrogenase/dehydrogenase, beta subunit C-terminal domain [Segatella copri]MBV3388658.1 Coenzyme F420 hydrogenase/dehydrogenase, beta subunit C-terminal domain [Segatella copri]MBV3396969.1 Coenzyme F420 hydrogenase/dehydrogenase, beta subunit C-terminal domain [Segatella copri]MBV3406097.1 Coenzyme F420 hydrogenase/dehydrogenase, beta subunit C-terminal domain [Segatella copri]